MAFAVVEIQGFVNEGTFVVKEMAVRKMNLSALYMFKPPKDEPSVPPSLRRSHHFCVKHLHGLPWTFGETPYEDFENILRRDLEDVSVIFTRGREKMKFLMFVTGKRVVDLDGTAPKASAAQKLEEYCPFHHNKLFCAYINAKFLFYWCKENDLSNL